MIPVLIEASVRVALVGCGVWLALRLTGVRSAAARHAVWAAVTTAMLVSPLWIVWSPRLPVAVPRVPGVEGIVPTLDVRVAETFSDAPPRPAASAATPAIGPVAGVTSAPVRRWSFLQVAAIVWLFGVSILLVRGAIGWRLARRLALDSTPVDTSKLPAMPCAPVVESRHVATPVVVGLWHPRIILPASWRTWPLAHLEAALVHESAHVGRRDALVSLIARLNHCVFWFHPLAWYLERAIARAAEQACDEVVVRRTGRGESYAALLVAMADAIRVQGGRVRWQAVGMAGHGRLEDRIDHVLAVGHLRSPSRARLVVLTLICAVTIPAGIACQQQPAPLRPNPEYTADLEWNREQARVLREMTPEQFDALEARATANPDDLEALETVLRFYHSRYAQDRFGWNEMIARRRPHLLRMIERHPESFSARTTILRQYDPEGYEQARALWLAHLDRPDVPAVVLGNAAEFFRAFEKPRAVDLLGRARALDPDGPPPGPNGELRLPWAMELGSVYAQAILGSNDQKPGLLVLSFSVEEARGAFAQSVRRMLQETTDVSLLFYVSQALMQNGYAAVEVLDFDPFALARSYLDRALELDPDSARVLALRASDDARVRYADVHAVVNEALTDAERAWAALTERERFDHAAEVAKRLYMGAEGPFADDAARMRASLDAARLFAEGAMTVSGRFREDPHFGTVVYDANIVLGLLALRDGDRRTAVDYLRTAANSPGSPEMEVGQLGPPRLVSYLLREGERKSIVAFYERLAELNPAGRERWLADADRIRDGQMTWSYQSIYGTDGS